MAFKAFVTSHVYSKQDASKERDKFSVQCVEWFDKNLYVGTKHAAVHHLILEGSKSENPSPDQTKTRECRSRKLGSSNAVVQLRAVPHFNHLLVLWDRSITALNMFSLESVPTMKKIQQVSLFEVSKSEEGEVLMVTSSSRRKMVHIHLVRVDRWELVKEVALQQDPVALAVDGATLCVATCDRYLLCDMETGRSEELFPHHHNKQRIIVSSAGQGEFLMNGPESLGMFVTKAGTCQRPPLQWSLEVQAARVCFPYVLTLQPHMLFVYSILDQRHKQTVSQHGAKGLLSTPDGVIVFTETDIFILHPVPVAEQIQALVGEKRVQEALTLLEGVQRHQPLDSYKELQKAVTCLAGFAHFYQQDFSEARDLFIKGDLDPREILLLYPDLRQCLSEDFQSQLHQHPKDQDLQLLWAEDTNTYTHYLNFLRDFLLAVRGTEQDLRCTAEVDCALLRLYTELRDTERLRELVSLPNECRLDYCVPVLEQQHRFFALGCLYQSHGKQMEALETWMKIVDGLDEDPSCSDVYGHIIVTLSELKDKGTVWKCADWTLQKNPEIAVRIFTRRLPRDLLETQDVLTFLEKYLVALILYLEFLINDLCSEEESHHNRLALAYVTQTLQKEEEADLNPTIGKLQHLLWESEFYDISTVYEAVKSTALHSVKAILLGRLGKHSQALQVLVHQEQNLQAALVYCHRASRDQEPQIKQALMMDLLQIYLDSEELINNAVDLLNDNPQAFTAQTVIQLLPDSWSVQLLSRFLVRSVRATVHQRRMVKLQKMLVQAELRRHKVAWQMQASKMKFSLGKEQACKVCQKVIAEPAFACNSHGDIVHISCSGMI